MPRKSRRASRPNDSLTPVKCVFKPSKISDDSCKACQPFILIDEVFGEWTCRICSRQEYGKKRMKKHVADKHETSFHTCGKLQGETSQDSTTSILEDNNNESKLSKSKFESMNIESVDKNDDTKFFEAIELLHDQDLESSVQDDENNESKLSKPEVEPLKTESVEKSFFQLSNNSADSCNACQPFILVDKVFGETTCKICGRQEYGEKRMKKHIAIKHETPLHTCGKLQEETNQDATIHIQHDNTNKSKLFESKVEVMNAESIDKNANTEEVVDQDMTSSVQDDKNDESKLSEPEVEPMETESVDKNADTEFLEAIELVHDQDPTSLKAKENATSKQEWQIVEITPTKKSFRKTSKSLFKLKNLKQSEVKSTPPISNPEQLNVDLIQSKNLQTSLVHPTSIPNLELFNVDMMESRNSEKSQVNNNVDLIQFKPLTPISPISNLEKFNMDLMHSIQGPQVIHTPVANLGQLNVDLNQPRPVKRSVRMHPTITQPRICPPRVDFSEDVVCQEFSPKEKSENLKKRKTNCSPIRTEKRSKIKSKACEYDATDLVNKILETKETKTDENNNDG